nr:DDE-type integrase/transposase/recombinase [Paraburkholderia sp. MMS20-SJTR3]
MFDFRFSARREVTAAKAFFAKAIRTRGRALETITLDGYVAPPRAPRETKTEGSLPTRTKSRSTKYPNNLVEWDHRHIKSRVNVMLGHKRFRSAAVALSAIELMHRIGKGQLCLTSAPLNNTTSPSV